MLVFLTHTVISATPHDSGEVVIASSFSWFTIGVQLLNSGTAWPTFPSGCGSEPSSPVFGTTGYDEVENWFIEEVLGIKKTYNAVSADYGAKAYLKEDFNAQEKRPNALIYSGIYNSRTGYKRNQCFFSRRSI